MSLIRIRSVEPVRGYVVRLTLSDGTLCERDLSQLLKGPVFSKIRQSQTRFDEVRAEGGTLTWPNGADLCPDVIIRGGMPPGGPSPALPSSPKLACTDKTTAHSRQAAVFVRS